MTKQKLYSSDFSLEKKTSISQNELEKVYQITSQNMAEIGLEVNDESKEIFTKSMQQNFGDKNFVFFMFYHHSQICGWASVYKKTDNLYLSDIELAPSVKGTRLLAFVLASFAKEKEFASFDKFTFYINKKNTMSNKTFSHLGGEIVEEKPNGFIYMLTREKLVEFTEKLRLT